MVVPETIAYPSSLRQKFDALIDVAGEVNLEQDAAVSILVVPEIKAPGDQIVNDVRFRGVTTLGGNGFAVFSGSDSSVWYHEYVHVLQRFETTRKTRWLTEGSATYLMHYLATAYGDSYPVRFEDHVTETGGYANETLSNPRSWEDGRVPYAKGKLVVAHLDGRIRHLTDGEGTILDVIRNLNEREGPVNTSEFKDAVAAVVGNRTLDDEIDRYVTTSAAPFGEDLVLPPEIEAELAPEPTRTPTPTSTATATPTETTASAEGDPPSATRTPTTPSTPAADGARGMPGFGTAVAVLSLLFVLVGIRLARR